MSDQLDNAMCLCLGAYEVLRRLNVPAESIFFVASIGDGSIVGLAFYGALLPVSACVLPAEKRVEAWERARAWWCDPSTPEVDLLQHYNAFAGSIDRVKFVMTVRDLERAHRMAESGVATSRG